MVTKALSCACARFTHHELYLYLEVQHTGQRSSLSHGALSPDYTWANTGKLLFTVNKQ